MPSFIVKNGPHPGHRIPIHEDADVGRDRAAALRLDDRTISRHHARVSLREGRVFVRDLGSQNGTAVNGMKVRGDTPLRDGDEVRFGNVVLTFLEERPAPPPDSDVSSVHLEDRPPEVLGELKAADLAASLLSGEGARSMETLRRRLRLLEEVAVALHRARDEEELCGLILDKLLEVFPAADRGFVLLHDAAREELKPAAVRVRPGIPGEIAISRTLVWDVLRNQRGVLSGNALEDGRFRRVETVVALGIRSVVCVPMVSEGKALGVIALDSLRSTGRFVTDDMALLGAIAAQAALALSFTRLHRQLLGREILERDLALARRIQLRFLPRAMPERSGWEFRASYEPAQEVGGDYYDVFELPGGRVVVGVGDVAGKGVSASLYMVQVRTAVRSHATDDPATILKRVNAALLPDIDEGMFITCAVAVIDPAARTLRLSLAGHPPPLLRRASGRVTEMTVARSSPLGIHEAAPYSAREFALGAGDTVVLYTDGVSEATDATGALFGNERLVEAVAAAEGSPVSVEASVLGRVAEFVGEAPQADDTTLVCFGPRS